MEIPAKNVQIFHPFKDGPELWMKRLDLIHPEFGGNKYFKLKYNIEKAQSKGHDTVLTFGGAFSNHIYSTAALCADQGLKSIGIIRGEAPKELSSTLQFAQSKGMHLKFVSREEYKEKDEPFFKAWLHDELGRFFLVPEGGSNFYGVQGCTEILQNDETFSHIACACGTGATAAGMLISSKESQRIIGFSALKGGDFLTEEIVKHIYWSLADEEIAREYLERFELKTDYHFGGYAKSNAELIDFIRSFHEQFSIKLDHVYTGKMMFGLFHMIRKGQFESHDKILCIHSGGLQGSQSLFT